MSALAKRPWLRALPALLYAGLVFYGGTTRVALLPETPLLSTDKLLHALAFAGLEGLFELWGLDLPVRVRRPLAVTASIGVGSLLELVQSALPYRSAEWLDLIADAVGSVLGACLLWAVACTPWGRRLAAWL